MSKKEKHILDLMAILGISKEEAEEMVPFTEEEFEFIEVEINVR